MPPAHEAVRIVPESAAGTRLDVWLAGELGCGRRAILRMTDRIRCNGRRVIKAYRVAAGDRVEVQAVPETPIPPPPIHRTSGGVLVLHKPAGLPTLTLEGAPGDSLATRLARHREPEQAGEPRESGLVQRLDTATSGLLLAGLDEATTRGLRRQMHGDAWQKTYLCLVEGRLVSTASVETPIGQHPRSRRRMQTVAEPAARPRHQARPAASAIEPLETVGTCSLVRVRTSTGVRHQVRVHLASIGYPILGDAVYGSGPLADAPGHCLHAESIRWRHPRTEEIEFDEVPPPPWWPFASAPA